MFKNISFTEKIVNIIYTIVWILMYAKKIEKMYKNKYGYLANYNI